MEPLNEDTNMSTLHSDDEWDTKHQELLDEWNYDTIKVLLRCIIETDFYPQLKIMDSSQVPAHWKKLHEYFCEQAEVIQYAATPTGKGFGEKYTSMEYVKLRFEVLEAEFYKVASNIMRTGSSGAESAAKHPHYEDLKTMTFGDPVFWPPYVMESSCVLNGALSGPVTYERREDGVSYTVTHTPIRPEWDTFVQDTVAQLLAAQANSSSTN